MNLMIETFSIWIYYVYHDPDCLQNLWAKVNVKFNIIVIARAVNTEDGLLLYNNRKWLKCNLVTVSPLESNVSGMFQCFWWKYQNANMLNNNWISKKFHENEKF